MSYRCVYCGYEPWPHSSDADPRFSVASGLGSGTSWVAPENGRLAPEGEFDD